MSKVSIIVPVYNVEQYLSESINSLLNQTLKETEIILINDGSTDKSYEICQKYAKEYPDKIVLISKENEGQGVARNIAIDKAKGEYLMFVDSDDYIDKQMVEKLYNKAIKDNADIVWCLMTCIIDGKKELQKVSIDSEDEFIKYILNNAGPCNKIVKKEIITKNKLYFPKIRAYEDVAVAPAWGLYAKKISYIDEGLYYYLIRSGSTMKQVKYNKKMEDIFYSLDNLYKEFNKQNKYSEELEWLFIEHMLHAASLRFFNFDNYKDNISRVTSTMKKYFPNWNRNKYYQSQSFKYKLICKLFYNENYWLLKLILRRRGV